MRSVHERAASVAGGNISVLICGETGVGKEIVAEILHRRSPRRDRPLLRLNCASLSESLVTSELFGHEKGSFTGAGQRKRGLLEAADGGTVFLDEIAEMPLSLQAKLLRVIEERRITPVGGLEPKPIDVRFVSATNRNLEEQIARGAFRDDFYFRLNGVLINVPPLRARRSEIAPLARLFIDRTARELGRRRSPAIADETMSWMLTHRWPGNVRELRNTMERAVLLCRNDVITLDDVREDGAALTRPMKNHELEQVVGGVESPVMPPVMPWGVSKDAELMAITDALDRCCGNQTRAARLLRISRGTLVSRLTAYGLPRPRKRGI